MASFVRRAGTYEFTANWGSALRSNFSCLAQKVMSNARRNQPTRLGLVTGDETVLIVEDHHDLRDYAAGVLRELGYTVLEAEFAQQALELLKTADLSTCYSPMLCSPREWMGGSSRTRRCGCVRY